MSKKKTIEKWGKDVVEKARDMYETYYGKVFFPEDCVTDEDIPLNSDERNDYLLKATILFKK